MHKTLTLAIVMTSSLAAGTAAAQEFADQGTLAFSADRLFGVYLTHAEADPDSVSNVEYSVNGTEVGLLWQGAGLTPYTTPRLGVDYFVINHLSVGGTIAYTSGDWEDDDDNGNDFNQNGFLLAPRVGGAWMFADWAGIWPRGGFTYFTGEGGVASLGVGDNTDASQFGLNAEALFVLSPGEGFAFTIGPAFDIGLTGKIDPPGPGDNDFHLSSIGILTAGVMGYINL